MRTIRVGALGALLVLLAAACGGTDGESAPTAATPTGGAAATDDAADGPVITVGSFNFPESVILANIYAQALDHAGYPVEERFDLGSRELIFPSLAEGEIDLLPEYVGSSIAVGFGEEPPTDTEAAVAQLRRLFEGRGVTVLDPAPGEDKNVFAVTEAFAQEHDVRTLSDLKGVDGPVTLAGPPECEQRVTCFAGLQETYGLDNLEFRSIQEGSARIAALETGQVDVALLFSTQPVIREKGFVVLEEDTPLIPPENIVPVVRTEIVDAYGDDLVALVNAITERIETETLLELNAGVELEARDPETVAQQWLENNGFLD